MGDVSDISNGIAWTGFSRHSELLRTIVPPMQMASQDNLILELDELKRSSLADRTLGPQGRDRRLLSEWSLRIAGDRDGLAQSSDITCQTGNRPDTTNSAWVWRPKDANSAWQRVFMVVEEAELKTFKDDKVAEPIERVQLGGSSVKEVSSSSREGARPTRTVGSHSKPQKRQYNKAVTIWTQASKVQGQLFVCPTRAGDKRVEICFAMEKAEEHPNFLSLLQTAADCEAQPSYDGRRMKTVGTGVDGCLTRDSGGLDVRTNDGWDSSLFCPDETIINHLCTAGLAQSVKLLDALHSTRLFLTEGQHSWGEPQTPCENAYLEFKSLHQQIGGMHAALAQHSKEIADDFSEAQKEAVNAARMWLERLQSWVKQKQDYMAALVLKSNIFASGWAVFVEMTIVQLQDIEQAMQLGELLAQHTGQGADAATLSSVLRGLPRPALPYNGHWRLKIAI